MPSLAAQKLQKLMDSRRVRGDRTHGFAGDLSGLVEAEKPGYMFVRVPKGSGWEVGEFPGSVSAAGIPVTLERDPFTGQQVVTTGGDGGAIAYNGGGSITVDPGQYAFSAHADRHSLTGDDQLNVSTLLLSPLTITVALPRLIVVGAGAFMISGMNYFKTVSSSLDLSSCYPATGVKYVWVLLSSTGVLSYQDDPATTYGALVQPPSTKFIVAIAQLQAGSNLKITDVLDLRFKQPILPKPTRGDLLTGQDATATWKVLAKGTQYQVLTGGVDEPTWGAVNLGQATAITGTLPVASGGTGIATTTAFSVICAGTTATGAFQSLAALGNAGQILTSNGAAALPTWQAAGGAALTATYVGFGDAGNLLTGSANLTWDNTRLMAQISDAATATVVYPIRISHITSNVAAVGFGAGMEFQLENAAGANKLAASVESYWKSAANSVGTIQMSVNSVNSGADLFKEVLVIVGSSSGALVTGNARGDLAIDIQVNRLIATQVASGGGAVIVGGAQNTSSGDYGTTVGGSGNVASGPITTIVGGFQNTVSAWYSVAVGGSNNSVAGEYCIAMGRRAIVAAAHDGSFLFADWTDADFNSVAAGEFAIRAANGLRVAFDDGSYVTMKVADTTGIATFDATGSTPGFVFTPATTFTAALTAPTLNMSATSDQLVLQSAGVTGTLTWTPATSNKTITLPNATGTVPLGTGTQFYLAVWSGTNTLTKLASTGNAGQWLQSQGGEANPAWASPFASQINIVTTSTPQLKIWYDGDNWCSISVAANGITTFATLPVGAGFVFTPVVTFTSTINGATIAAASITLANTGSITLPAAATTITGGGTLALGTYTLTIPATGTVALLGTANAFTATQSIAIGSTTATTTLLAVSATFTAAAGTIYGIYSSMAAAPTEASTQSVYGGYTLASATSAYNVSTIIGYVGGTYNNSTAIVANQYGVYSFCRAAGTSGTATSTNVYGIRSEISKTGAGGTWVIGTAFHVYITPPTAASGTLTGTTLYGIYLGDFSTPGGTWGTAWSIYSVGGNNAFGGNTRIGGVTAPVYTLDVTGNIKCTTGFGCNGANPQTAYASGGAVAPGAGAFGASSAANFAAMATLVANIRLALVAQGSMS